MTEEHSLLTGSVPKKLAAFAFPLLLANILQSFYNVVDMLVVGQIVGDTGLAAIGNASKLCYIINSICPAPMHCPTIAVTACPIAQQGIPAKVLICKPTFDAADTAVPN